MTRLICSLIVSNAIALLNHSINELALPSEARGATRSLEGGDTSSLNKAEYHKCCGNYPVAIDAFTRYLDSHPKSATAFAGRALCYLHLGYVKKSTDDFESGREINPDDPAVRLFEAVMLLRNKSHSKAFDLAKTLISNGDFIWEAGRVFVVAGVTTGRDNEVEMLLLKLKRLNKCKMSEWESLEAERLRVGGMGNIALKHIKLALNQDNDVVPYNIIKANILLDLGEVEAAVHTLESCESLKSSAGSLSYFLAGLYLKAGQLDKSRKSAKKAMEILSGNEESEFLFLKSTIVRARRREKLNGSELEQASECTAALTKLCRRNISDSNYWLFLAETHRSAGRYNKSIEITEEFNRRNGWLECMAVERVQDFAIQGEKAKAKDLIGQILGHKHLTTGTYERICAVMMYIGDYSEGLKISREGIKRFPRSQILKKMNGILAHKVLNS